MRSSPIHPMFAAVVSLLSVLSGGCATQEPREIDAFQIITHPLAVGYHTSVSLAEKEAAGIVGGVSQILTQCNARASMSGVPSAFSVGNGTINNEADYNAVGAVMIMGTPRRVRVVAAINWCGKFNAGYIGCAPTPGTFLVVERRITISAESALWSHEFGHTKGLAHRDQPSALMNSIFDPNNTALNSTECQAIRGLALLTKEGPPTPQQVDPSQAPADVLEFVRRSYIHGVPYSIAKRYPSSDADKLVTMLKDPAQTQYWRNAVAVLAIISNGQHADVIFEFIRSSRGSGDDAAKAKHTAVLSLGYMLNKTGSPVVLEYLRRGLDPEHWNRQKLPWRASFHASPEERNWQLVMEATIALGLSGNAQAAAALNQAGARVSAAPNRFREQFQNTAREALATSAVVQQRGLDGYYSNK